MLKIVTIQRFFLILMLMIICINICPAQEVEHNYLVGPQSTTCDSLKMHDLSIDQCIEQIRKSNFRFDQTFRLTRKKGLQQGEFYSCDGKVGFLIIKFNDEEQLYQNVEKTSWELLISSSDPEGYYLKRKQQFQIYND